MVHERLTLSSGAPWEAIVGYSRAVRVGPHVHVSGTTATDAAGEVVGVGDAGAQTRFVLEKLDAVLARAGATRADVVRTRMFVTDIARWEEIGRVHGEFFAEVRPAATMVEVQRLIHPDLLVEIEVDAYLG